MLKLFAVTLGGRADGCNVELHDIVFVVGKTLEETYPALMKKWFGNKKRLHIDSSIELQFIDGHEVIVTHEKRPQDKKLFLLNFGAYKPDHFGEIHETAFYVATSKADVLIRAKADLCLNLLDPHCDDNLLIDDIVTIDEIDQYAIQLVPTTQPATLPVISGYRRLDVSAAS